MVDKGKVSMTRPEREAAVVRDNDLSERDLQKLLRKSRREDGYYLRSTIVRGLKMAYNLGWGRAILHRTRGRKG